ncbi:hypothetical protein [Photobacterium phosphoreum]|jgi:cbb3-type cytochrome oxidase subunit 3|uniref:hypothetical protein n=1 Tax=Photobacterium phosphoreum TaxID=659 RepID=UPI0005D3E38B|nr:hypothetical protein [Photobacterium phosphoreum]KJF88082.1 membrane protein [Photobacterium phosphoreum]MCD9471198.1 hypothetical protein [Photobacterium phosphoreum]MCD9474875.1 hypothetical protein [Photobacterium phosphoreum]MCD9502104.1 hypothetical protein [Photobacterium phosphoreum]MCD9506723.1 hypothetical protein [Photobacterium phosphoreum]
MKKAIIAITMILIAILFSEHFHSFSVGLTLAIVAVSCSYLIAYQSILRPQYTMSFLVVAVLTKLAITVTGVIWVFSANIIHSPITFLVAYALFSVGITYFVSRYRSRRRDISDQQQRQIFHTGLYELK